MTFTKEQLIKWARERKSQAEDFPGVENAEKDLVLAEIALASLEAEPVADVVAWSSPNEERQCDIRWRRHDVDPGPLYTVPPAQNDYFSSLVAAARIRADKAMLKFPQPNYVLNKVAEESGEVIKEVIHYTEGRGDWNKVEYELIDNLAMLIRLVIEGDQVIGFTPPYVCRGAILQGSQPVSNRDELLPGIKPAPELDSVAKNAESLPGNSPVIGWLRSDYNSDDKRDPNAPLFMLGSNDPSETWGVKYLPLSGNSPVIPDGYVVVPKRLTAENGAKFLLVGEFSETKFINCTECFGDDECETCDGSGRIEISVPVSWTNIKAIWAKGVEHFAAAPKQETL